MGECGIAEMPPEHGKRIQVAFINLISLSISDNKIERLVNCKTAHMAIQYLQQKLHAEN